MKLNEFGDYANQLKRINRYLQENFGYTINMESIDSDRVNSTLKKVLARQAQIANETNVKDYHKIPEYNKTVMVAEALKILLKEIAPKRQAKEKDTNVQESKMTKQVKEQEISGPGGGGISVTRPGSGNNIQVMPGPKKGDRKGGGRKFTATSKKGSESDAKKNEGIRRVKRTSSNTKNHPPKLTLNLPVEMPPQLQKPIGKASQQPTADERDRFMKGKSPIMKIRPPKPGKKQPTMTPLNMGEHKTSTKHKHPHESVNPRSVTLENLRTLLEQDLDQAELVLAAKDMVDRIQKMAENLAEMQVEELMPLVDAMKEHFGPDVAQVFNSSVEATLQQALDTIKATRDGVDNAVLALTGEAPVQSDMGAMPAPEMGMDADPGMEVPPEEDFGGDEAMAGDTPAIGREMKPESVSTFALTQAKKILMQGAKNGKVSKQAVKEAALALTQKKKVIIPEGDSSRQMGRDFAQMVKNFGRKVKSGEAWEEYKQAQADAERAATDAGIDLGAQRSGEGQHVKPSYDSTPHEPTRKFIKKYVTEPYDIATDWMSDKASDVGDFSSGFAGGFTKDTDTMVANPKKK